MRAVGENQSERVTGLAQKFGLYPVGRAITNHSEAKEVM